MPKRSARRGTVKHRNITEKQLANLRPFVPGDPRINRLGRPKSHDELRALIQSLAAESSDNAPDWSRIEFMLRSMLTYKNATDRANVLEHGWGKVPQSIEHDVSEQLKQIMDQLGLTPTDVNSDPVLAELFGVASVKVDDDAGA